MLGIIVAVTLVALHMIDGRTVTINPKLVTQLREVPPDNESLADAVNCVVKFVDGSYASVAELCSEVRKLMEGAKP